jgi:eukaryotic-like serine/threonine-protein kinase
MLEEAGLVVADVVTEPDPLLRKGLVIRTDPPPGTVVDPGTSMVLVISAGRE